jgi:hypothetical protein
MRADLSTIAELTQRNISKNTSKKLPAESEAQPGISASASFQLKHTGRSRGIDVRDLSRPIISSPGGPTWNFNDWAEYPESVNRIEQIWTEDDFLYFDVTEDQWYYRITRPDLRRQKTELTSFLRPIHDVLVMAPEYKRVLETRHRLAVRVNSLTAELTERIRQPKRLSDLWDP